MGAARDVAEQRRVVKHQVERHNYCIDRGRESVLGYVELRQLYFFFKIPNYLRVFLMLIRRRSRILGRSYEEIIDRSDWRIFLEETTQGNYRRRKGYFTS